MATADSQASQPGADTGMSIGAVLDVLRPDFPDVTISKIRFLESEGLIAPERRPSGYRRFSAYVIEQLRFILTAQRDQYLPLKVIKEQLDALGDGELPVGPARLSVAGTAAASTKPARQARLRVEDVAVATGCAQEFVDELTAAGVLTVGAPGSPTAGFYDEFAVDVVKTAMALTEFGVEVRHLRAFRSAADREASLISQIAGPIARGRGEGARDRAADLVREVASLSLALHGSMVKSAVRSALD